ncbi:hypothetical protein GCM10009117_21390 [Gangjinia marincola]|uniref:Uncharacterized protein n=2 Tax=Gangjinia marincola TaxID=578463 RepID=A0ABN1MJB5_9FLAO
MTAQEKTINEITQFEVRNSGVMLDNQNDVDGYYFFYEVDRLKKGQREFAIEVIDNSLNEVAKKSYIDDKRTYLVDSKFNNQALIFALANKKEKFLKVITFDRKANQKEDIDIPLTSKELKYLAMMEQTGSFNMLFPVDNKGFLVNYVKDNKKIGYSLKYVATDGNSSWEYNSPLEDKLIYTINPIEANEEVVVALEGSRKSNASKKIDYRVIVIDIDNGKMLFESKFERNDNPRLVTNAFLTDEKKLVVLGEYFENGAKIFSDKSAGLFAETFNLDGTVLRDSKISWENEIDPKMPSSIDGKKKKRGYIYFHDIVRTNDGSYYAIGERYRKTASAAGIASLVLGGGNSQTPLTQLTITNAAVFKFDNTFKLEDVKVFEKGKSRAPSVFDFGSPQFNAHILKTIGAFDFEFTQRDITNDRFYSTFIDYERLKGERNKFALKTVIYNDGNLSQDKMYLNKSNGTVDMRVLPGKLGSVMLVEYNKKDKTVQLHLEKLNLGN